MDKPTGNEAARGTLLSYSVGFGLSILLTLAAYLLVARHVHSHHQVFSDGFLTVSVVVLALIQFFVQLVFFLHLGRESKPRWNLLAFSFAAIVVFILVFGSLWIMSSLNYHHTPTTATPTTDTQIIKDEGITP